MKIILDLDGIVVDLMTPWLAAYNAAHDDDVTPETITSWDMHKHVKAGKAIYGILNKPGFFRHLKMLPGAEAAVKELQDAGHEVWIVTSAVFPCNYADKVEWVAQYLPMIPKRQLVLADAKEQIHADVLIDDGPHNATAYRKAHPQALIMTIGHPYNGNCWDYDLVAGSYKDTATAWKIMMNKLYSVEAENDLDLLLAESLAF